jgi:hypothetical protein
MCDVTTFPIFGAFLIDQWEHTISARQVRTVCRTAILDVSQYCQSSEDNANQVGQNYRCSYCLHPQTFSVVPTSLLRHTKIAFSFTSCSMYGSLNFKLPRRLHHEISDVTFYLQTVETKLAEIHLRTPYNLTFLCFFCSQKVVTTF